MNRKSMVVCFKMVCMTSCEGDCLKRHDGKKSVDTEDRACY